MAKKIEKTLKLQIPAGKATPAPPLGPILGQAGINMGEFVNQFNDKTKDMGGDLVSVVLQVYGDRSFDFIIKTPPASFLIKKTAGIQKGSPKQREKKVGKLSKQQVREIAEIKMSDLNANDIDAAEKIVEGTARSMGVETGG